MRPVWNGSISFGLVNVPVSMYGATNPRQGIDLDMLHKEDSGPIRYARICRKDGQEIPWDEIVKGYEYRDGDYVVLTQKDLDSIDVKKTQTIDIEQFLEEKDLDIRYLEKPYYLESGKGGEKAYALLREALAKSGKLALAKFVLHERQHIAVIKPIEHALVLIQMRFPTDLRDPKDLHFPGSEVNAHELEVALKLIHQDTHPFRPDILHDTYTDDLEKLIKEKTKGKKIYTPTSDHHIHETSSKDLMNALKASLKG